MIQLIGASVPNGKLLTTPQIVITILQVIGLAVQINGLIKLWPNSNELFRSIILYLLGFQSVIRGISRFTRDDEKALKELYKIIDDFYVENEKNETFCKILKFNVRFFRKLVVAYLFISCIIYHLPAATGLISIFINGNFVLPVPIKFPYIDTNSIFGFFICQILTVLVSTTLFLIIAAGDVQNIYFTLQSISMVDILSLKLQILGDDFVKCQKLETEVHKRIYLLKYRKRNSNFQKFENNSIIKSYAELNDLKILKDSTNQKFLSLINKYNNYNYYISKILSFRELITFTTLYLNFIGIGLSLVLIKLSSVLFGIVTGIIFTLQVFANCLEGTLVSSQNKKLLTKVQEFPWYELSNSQKKIFLQFICICQSTNSFNLPIFGDINMQLFTDIMQAAYSFLMYINQFVK